MQYRSDLVCLVSKMSYNFATRTGKLEMAPDHSCDMTGCIALFEKIDADVKQIDTFAGDVVDTQYIRRLIGDWDAVLAKQQSTKKGPQ